VAVAMDVDGDKMSRRTRKTAVVNAEHPVLWGRVQSNCLNTPKSGRVSVHF